MLIYQKSAVNTTPKSETAEGIPLPLCLNSSITHHFSAQETTLAAASQPNAQGTFQMGMCGMLEGGKWLFPLRNHLQFSIIYYYPHSRTLSLISWPSKIAHALSSTSGVF